MDPLEDATGSPFVRLTGSCTVPEFSEVEELSGGAPTLLRSSFSLRPDAYLKRSNRLTHLGHSWSAEVKALRGRYLEGAHFVALWFAVLGSAKFFHRWLVTPSSNALGWVAAPLPPCSSSVLNRMGRITRHHENDHIDINSVYIVEQVQHTCAHTITMT